MYLEFYGLAEKPFSTTPDPRFLYLTPRHQEALAQLTYGVQDDQGFMVLTGAIGTGKTTLLHKLREQLNGTVTAAFISNTLLPFEGLLEFTLGEFGIDAPTESHVQRLMRFKTFLGQRHEAGQKPALVLDEAQNLSSESLEQIRLLSNFEKAGARLLRIVLVGQPELELKLALPGLRQLRQRIGLQFNIEPLTAAETRDYIRARLRIAGATDRGIFTERAVERIVRYSGGTPRVINILCDHCLLIGYADQRRRIEPDIVEEARVHLDDGGRRRRPESLRPPEKRRWTLWPWRRSRVAAPFRSRQTTRSSR